jgi:predicted nucleic acid-binding protein
MNGSPVYLDASGFVKTLSIEAETDALAQVLQRSGPLVSSALLEVEARRVALRLGTRYVPIVEGRLRDVAMVAITTDLLVAAGALRPANLRSLDALHLATAMALGPDLAFVVTYDQRMTEAAVALGLPVRSPR